MNLENKKEGEKLDCVQKMNLIANVATIIGVIVAVVAFSYAFQQYHTYKKELARKPEVDLRIAPISRPDEGVFSIQGSNDYSNKVEIGINIVNKGNLYTSQVYATVAFNEKVQVLSVNYSDPSFKLPIEDKQIFMFTNMNFPLPPHFTALPLLKFDGQLHKDCFKETKEPVIVGIYYVQGGGEKVKSFLIEFEPRTETFQAIPCDLSYRFETGRLNLKEK